VGERLVKIAFLVADAVEDRVDHRAGLQPGGQARRRSSWNCGTARTRPTRWSGLRANARVYVLKRVLHDWDEDRCVAILAYAGGRERSEAEFAQLLAQASLSLTSTTALTAGPHLLEVVAV
jgi:hypothetical protein